MEILASVNASVVVTVAVFAQLLGGIVIVSALLDRLERLALTLIAGHRHSMRQARCSCKG